MILPRLSYLVVVGSLSIFLATLATIQGDSNRHPLKSCNDSQCDVAANDILDCQNQSVHPCDDFYEHACGGCGGPTDGYNHILFSKVSDQTMELFNDTRTSDGEAMKKSKELYDSCMAWDDVKNSPLMFIKRILTDNGEWPIIVSPDEWNNRNLTWQEIHENFVKRLDISALFDVNVRIYRRLNSTSHQLSLVIPHLPSYDFDNATDYEEYLVNSVDKIKNSRGLNATDKDVLDDIRGIVEFDYKLAEAMKKSVPDKRYVTIETLQNDWDAVVPRNSTSSINWLKTINDRFEGTGIVIDASEQIYLFPESIVADLARALVNTPVRTIVNYIHWNVIYELFEIMPMLKSKVPDQIYTSDRSRYCITHHPMDHAISYRYAKRHFNETLRTSALEIIQQIRDEMKREISDSSWLDDTAKSLARGKLDNMTIVLGYPEWYDEPGEIDEYYRELTVGPDYIENHRAYSVFEWKKGLSKLRSPVTKSETELSSFRMSYADSPSYNYKNNSLYFPAGSFQLSTFDLDRPSVLIYGEIGSVVGHEVAHGLDSQASHYDKEGNEIRWVTKSTIKPFKTKVKCFIEQYNKYTFKDEHNTKAHMNGLRSRQENIADTVGCRASLRAYQRAKNDGKTSNVNIPSLEGVPDEQLYFYKYASTWCTSKETQDTLNNPSKTHSPNRLRVIGAVSNLQEFADAFHCPSGSPMNPSKKCLIWD